MIDYECPYCHKTHDSRVACPEYMKAYRPGGIVPVDNVQELLNPARIESAVLHPKHYARWKMEPIEFIAINNLPWWLANIIKYTMRFDAKDGLQDLYKARSYLEMKIRQLEGAHKFWEKPVAEERTLNLNNASR